MSPRILETSSCPHCRERLEPPTPRVCPHCGGSLQKRFLSFGCLSSAPLIAALLAAAVAAAAAAASASGRVEARPGVANAARHP
jgi:predicted amidophosphoribosyltransferase